MDAIVDSRHLLIRMLIHCSEACRHPFRTAPIGEHIYLSAYLFHSDYDLSVDDLSENISKRECR